MGNSVECLQAANAIVGEGPLWCPHEQVLYWLDIKRPAVYRYQPGIGQTGVWPLTQQIGSLALCEQGGLLLALEQGFHRLDLDSGTLTALHDPEPERPQHRFNDGKVDRRGRFWAGTLTERGDANGRLYRLDTEQGCTRMLDGLRCSNGIGWSPDNRHMYLADSLFGCVWVLDFDLDDGVISNRRIFAEVPATIGLPDGLTVDADACVWLAIWGGARLLRYTPDGKIERTVGMPVPLPSSVMFGGSNLDTLYISSASLGLSAAHLQTAPLSGGLFCYAAPCRGLPEPRYAG